MRCIDIIFFLVYYIDIVNYFKFSVRYCICELFLSFVLDILVFELKSFVLDNVYVNYYLV